MRIGFVVDGEAEYRSIRLILDRVATADEFLRPRRADIQPLASTPQQMIRAVRQRLIELAARGADRVIILIDLEGRPDCPGAWAHGLRTALSAGCADCGVADIRVVIKKRMYENWLMGDPDVLSQMPARFTVSAGDAASIVPNKADQVDALAILKRSVKRGNYDKVEDAIRIMARADPMVVARNSRSFRKLLRLIGSATYIGQSVNPAP